MTKTVKVKVCPVRYSPQDIVGGILFHIGEPGDYAIFNAPRPLIGNVTWQGSFLHGVFYAGVYTNEKDAAFFIQRCADLDAVVFDFVTDAEVYEKAQVYYDEFMVNHKVNVRDYSIEKLWPAYVKFIHRKEREFEL